MNLLVWNSLVSQPVGGMERFALGLACRLAERGQHVVLVGAYDNAPELRAQIPAGMPYYHFDLHGGKHKPHWTAARRLYQIIREHQIDVVTAHGNVFALQGVCRLRGVPLVWTIHGAEARQQSLIGRLKTAAVRRVMASPNTHIISVSAATAAILRGQFPELAETRHHIIHSLAGLQEEPLLALPLPKAGPPWNLGFIGRLVERKRPLDLVHVMLHLGKDFNGVMHVFGDGPLRGALENAIREHGLEQRIVLHGYWDKGSAGMVEQLHVLVHPDSHEPFGGALLEAQFGGRPVVAYAVGGNPEIVQHGATGWLVPPGDPQALADGVRQVTGANYQTLACAARANARRCFTVEQMVNQHLALFERLCVKN